MISTFERDGLPYYVIYFYPATIKYTLSKAILSGGHFPSSARLLGKFKNNGISRALLKRK